MDIDNNENFKIYHIADEQEKIKYIQNNTNALNGINLDDIKQIETNFDNNVYVLLKNGEVYKDNKYLATDINEIYFLTGFNLYLITNDNIILPTEDVVYWDNLDFYLNNNNGKYNKILTDPSFITALTQEKKVIAVAQFIEHGIIPENFLNVDDILQIEDEPYIVKNGKTTPLYVH